MKINKNIVKALVFILSVQLLSCTQKKKEVSYFDTQAEIDYSINPAEGNRWFRPGCNEQV